MPFANNGNPSPYTIKIERHLIEIHEAGRVVGYKELQILIGESVRVGTRGSGYLRTARRRILASHGFHTITLPGLGLKFPTPGEHLADSADQRRFLSRKAKRSNRAAQALPFDQLEGADRSFHMASVGQFNAVEHIMSSHRHKRLQASIGPIMPDAKTLLEHLK